MRKMFRFLFWVALFVTVVVGALRLTAIRWWRVPNDDRYLTASTSPSVRAGDLILLWRLTKPGFGDLVLCPEPGHPERVVIGRIVGEQGDQVAVNGASIELNGKSLPTETRCPKTPFKELSPENGTEVEQACSLEVVGSRVHMRGDVPAAEEAAPAKVAAPPQAKIDDVPDGHVYLVSDNRLFPWDSREFGPVPRATCKETVFFRLLGRGGYFDTSTRNQLIQ